MRRPVIIPENAELVRGWFENRGGLAVWRSADLSDPGWSNLTPALQENGEPMPPPHWKSEKTPEQVVTTTDGIDVVVFTEVKRFHVALKRGNNFDLKLTEASSQRVRRAVSKAGEGAIHRFDYCTQEAVILKQGEKVSLTDYLKRSADACIL